MQGKEASQPEASSTSDLPGDLESLSRSSPGLGFPICERGGGDREKVGTCGLQARLRAMFLGALPALLKFLG